MSKHKHRTTRKAPAHKAKKFKLKTKKKGIDGKFWIVSKRVDGIKYWKRFKKGKKINRKNTLRAGLTNNMNILSVDDQSVTNAEISYSEGTTIGQLKQIIENMYPYTKVIRIIRDNRSLKDTDILDGTSYSDFNVIITVTGEG